MVKMVATHEDGSKILMLGLSQENVNRLKEGKPILFGTEDLGLGWNGRVCIFYGKTEHDMLEDVSGWIGPHSKISIDPRSL